MDTLPTQLASLPWLELLALAGTFIAGLYTGAARTYIGQKWTDERKEKERVEAEDTIWEKFVTRFPAIAEELHKDFSKLEHQNVRVIYVKESWTQVFWAKGKVIEYHTDKHDDLNAAISYLEEFKFVSPNIATPKECQKHNVFKKLVDRLIPD